MTAIFLQGKNWLPQAGLERVTYRIHCAAVLATELLRQLSWAGQILKGYTRTTVSLHAKEWARVIKPPKTPISY